MKALRVDEFGKQGHAPVKFLKQDVEEAEMNELKKVRAALDEESPGLAVSICCSTLELIEILVFLGDLPDGCTYQLGHYAPALRETVSHGAPSEASAA